MIAHKPTVLFVDPDVEVSAYVERVLHAAGVRVLVASDAQQALRCARRHGDELDGALCELALPDLDGHTLLGALDEIRPGLSTAVVGSLPREQAARRYGLPDGMAYVEKPLGVNTLLGAARRLVRRGVDFADAVGN